MREECTVKNDSALMTAARTGLCNLLSTSDFLPSANLKLGQPPSPEHEAEEPRRASARIRRVIYDKRVKRTIPEDCPLRHDWTIAGDS